MLLLIIGCSLQQKTQMHAVPLRCEKKSKLKHVLPCFVPHGGFGIQLRWSTLKIAPMELQKLFCFSVLPQVRDMAAGASSNLVSCDPFFAVGIELASGRDG